MYKVAALGDFESTAYFGCIGAETFFVKSKAEAEETIKRLTASGYAVIFVSERYLGDFAQYENSMLPAVIPLPCIGSEASVGVGLLKKYVKRAVGSDIIFKDEEGAGQWQTE